MITQEQYNTIAIEADRARLRKIFAEGSARGYVPGAAVPLDRYFPAWDLTEVREILERMAWAQAASVVLPS